VLNGALALLGASPGDVVGVVMAIHVCLDDAGVDPLEVDVVPEEFNRVSTSSCPPAVVPRDQQHHALTDHRS
jgi:hypothetical protein